ncbi:heme ABC transporter permease [Candidatus Albibeggiatoa sp. nov. BB20]|uniref:heme ABC transporter permease n=1 Tax=Candidatus Albibeggiatoa sp. nov. BB20 TaxID=3162723 RepID=UPI00336547BA
MNILKFLWTFYHQMASPRHFYGYTNYFIPFFTTICMVLMVAGLYYGLFVAPPDYQQGDSYRIMFIHVPAAWMSLFVYMVMATMAVVSMVWRLKLAEIIGSSSALIGAAFTFLALVTGSIWGKPMWGTWWAWDARLTSELILFFLYLGIIALNSAIEDKRKAAQATSVLTLVGVVNIPIIHYSVTWWNSLHQGATIDIMKGKVAIDIQMLIPLILMAFAFKFFYAAVVLKRARCEVLNRERNSTWVKELISQKG